MRLKNSVRICNQSTNGGIIMSRTERFEKIYSQGIMNTTEIWVDKETGVNYLWHKDGYGGGLTVLLDKEGKPVISTIIR